MASAAIVVQREDASWLQTHEKLVRLATERAELDFEEGRLLLRARREGIHVRIGYAAFYEYTERLFGYGPRLTQEKLRVAEALEELPETAKSLQTGAISCSHARELTRVATPSTETAWLEAARGRTVREVEQLVSGHRPGSLPDDVPAPDLKRHVLRLELSSEVMATFRKAMAKIRRDEGESLDDDAAIRLLCRKVLGGSGEPGRASESRRRVTRRSRGQLVQVGAKVVAMAAGNAQHVGHVGHVDAHVGAQDSASFLADVGAILARGAQDIPAAIRRLVDDRDGGRCRVPGCRHSVFKEPHHIVLRSEGGTHHPDNLVTVCSAHHRAIHNGTLLVTGSAFVGVLLHAC